MLYSNNRVINLDQPTIAEIKTLPWFHSIDFGGGLISPGQCEHRALMQLADVFFSESVAGKTVIDIGCWDGFFSIEAAKRGASHVLATDHYVWQTTAWANRRCFDIARDHLAPAVDVRDIDVLDISPDTVGMHDFVIFVGVLYHMRHPLLALERAASVCSDLLLVETHHDAMNEKRPAMIFYPGLELNNDSTNWWGPNIACVQAMLRDLGFCSIKYQPRPHMPHRGIFHARRK
jgi:tRNA (mo5U34)-methyltransferase